MKLIRYLGDADLHIFESKVTLTLEQKYRSVVHRKLLTRQSLLCAYDYLRYYTY